MGTVRTTKGEHNKPAGCSASGAYAPGPDYEEEEEGDINHENVEWVTRHDLFHDTKRSVCKCKRFCYMEI